MALTSWGPSVPVNYSVTTIAGRLQVVVSDIDAGATNGALYLLESGGTVLSTLSLARPCGVVTGNQLIFSGMSLIDPAASAGGFAVAARISDGDGNAVITGLTVGTGSTSEIVMSPTNFITAGQTVAITTATITGH
jgi:hypothetical protein